MGVHRTPEQLKPVIIKGTQHIVAVGGMVNFSFPKLTAEIGISAPTVYEHYKNKEDLLTTCFMEIDGEVSAMIAKMLKGVSLQKTNAESFENLCWLLWISYWNYLTADADRTLFYWSFYNSPYYTSEIQERRDKNFKVFLKFIQAADERFSVSSKCNVYMLVTNIINGTVSSAVKILRGEYENDDVNVNTVYHMVFQPLFSVFGIQGDKNTVAGGMLLSIDGGNNRMPDTKRVNSQ